MLYLLHSPTQAASLWYTERSTTIAPDTPLRAKPQVTIFDYCGADDWLREDRIIANIKLNRDDDR